MAPKRKALEGKALVSKKAKQEPQLKQQKLVAAEPAEVWFSLEHWYFILMCIAHARVQGASGLYVLLQ